MAHISEAQRELLIALNDPSKKTYVGGFDIVMVFEAERLGLIEGKPDSMFPSFIAYHLTDKGRAALGKKAARA